MVRRLILSVAVAAGIIVPAATALSADDHRWPRSRPVRLAAAEILVMAGDARRLTEENLPPLRQRGVRDRLLGSMSGLPLLLRLAGHPAEPGEIESLRAAIAAENLATLRRNLDALAARVPLDTTGILPPDQRPRARRLALALHDGLCAGCHDGQPPDPDDLLPAEDLFQAAGTMPLREFAARLMIGVRGDTLTAFAQPLTDGDLAALLGLYLNGAE
ncbi:MAG: hypothetical protein WCZ23_00885 [Rhodospirillaceae bacterium]